MDLRTPDLALNLIFDAEFNAFNAAVSEGWPLPRHRTLKARLDPRDEPASAFLIPDAGRRTGCERIAA